MPREFPRARRVGEMLQRELAELVRDELNDPRVRGITITEVECSRDLSHAKVWFSTLDLAGPGAEAKSDHDAIRKVLDGAAGALRVALRERVRMRSLPMLSFHYDDSLARGAHLEALIARALDEDKQHQPAAGASEEE